MEVRAGGAPGRSDTAEHGPSIHCLPILHGNAGEMPLARGDAVAVVDLDHPAVAACPFGRYDTPAAVARTRAP
jgi:hypothetical protein